MNRYMIRIVALAATTAAVALAWTAGASKATAVPTAVATIDLPRVLEALDESAAEVARSQAAGEAFQGELRTRKEDLDGLAADLEDFVPGTPKYAEAERALKKASIDIRAFMGLVDLREARTTQRAMLRIYNHIRDSAASLAEQEGYGMVILDDSAIPIMENTGDVLGEISSRRVLFASPTLDISDQLIEYMNTQWRAAHGG
ncbi:MAG: OmpH family outer membrane protein [Phycisphaerales bacterium]|jgi:Skp family chaperone for outer membrane proteins|nr:OmpH family outer membrane protein [Phycisphaerales bacterium]